MGGNSDIGFSFDGNAPFGPYQLWKPPGQYFPNGEPPPTYSEAVALAQAESLNACTVSVATTTHRTLPLTVCTTDTDLSSNITANTTNLINININNAGNITAVATGENHILNGSFARSRSPGAAFARSHEMSTPSIGHNSDINPSIYPCGPQMVTMSSQDVPCTLQNCELNTSCLAARPLNCAVGQTIQESQPIATVSHSVPPSQISMDRLLPNDGKYIKYLENHKVY